MLSNAECYNAEEVAILFANAGSEKEIALSYELLIVAYRAALRYDFRSAVIIAATAVEKSILIKIQYHYNSNNINTFERDKNKHRMLGRNELNCATDRCTI